MDPGFTFVVGGFILTFYFMPTVIASLRHSQHTGTIFIVNLVFGWTVLGWLAALIWAIVETPKPITPPSTQRTDWAQPFYK
jgi:hypothetical protein